jgi:hypothetical protein
MSRKASLLIALALVLSTFGSAYAQGPDQPDSDPFWHSEYWNNTTLSGTPVVQQDEENLDWDWGTGSPAAGVNADRFSARWTRYIYMDTAGTYRLTATADDGIRVRVDGSTIIDEWYDHSVLTFTADVGLSAGHHRVEVEYYENSGDAVAKLSWATAPVTFSHWRGEYYNNMTLSGDPVLVRDDTSIDFNWGSGTPGSGLPSDGFSVRWTRTVDFGSGGFYRFTATSDDGARLWINGHLLVDKWFDRAFTAYSGDIYVSGEVPIKLEYYENGGLAAVRLTWTLVSGTTPPAVPSGSIVVDDTDPGFEKGGVAAGWRTAAEGYGNHLTWTRNNDWPRYNYNWARWYPSLSAGRYEVFVFIPYRYTTTSKARYWIAHRDGYTLRLVNQSLYDNQWVSLGTYWFRGTRSDYVSLADSTYETYRSRLIAFDAVRWDPR